MTTKCCPSELPYQKELILQLLKQELKSYRFFNGLREVGLDDSFYHSDFSSLVLTYIGFDDEENVTYDFYFALLEKYSTYFQPNEETVTKLALSVYLELVLELKSRKELSRD
ncbi:hypothetical protein ACFQ21_21665 [Ohtaekwangia kribbensis]|uniref:Uncharacterized protein n=1 Tax=Ohtaekwangia kribbensis TaxID=688913 RepID=A0ABW3K7F5_9BACT